MSLDLIVTAKINQMMESGEMDSIVSKQVNDMLHSALRSVFSSYKGVGEDIEKMITNSLRTKLGEISIDQYTSLVAKVIQTRVNNNLLELSEETVEKALEDLLDRAPEKIKLSDIVEKYKEQFDGESGEISLEVKEEYTWTSIILKKDESDKFEKIEILVNTDGKMFSLRVGYGEKKPEFFSREVWGFSKTIMDLYCRGSKIEIDEDDCSLSYGEY